MATRTLTINLDPATLSALQASGFHLYAFLPMASSNKSGVPLVWLRIDSYLETIPITYTSTALTAYISTSPIAANQAVAVGASTPVAAGQTVYVASGGALNATSGAPTGDIYLSNDAGMPYTGGLTVAYQSAVTPCCGFALYPSISVTLAPLDAIFVMWATSTYDPAVYMAQCLGPGLFVQFAGNAQRSVTYDITQGWGAGGATWATAVPAGANLVQTLIVNPGKNQPRRP